MEGRQGDKLRNLNCGRAHTSPSCSLPYPPFLPYHFCQGRILPKQSSDDRTACLGYLVRQRKKLIFRPSVLSKE